MKLNLRICPVCKSDIVLNYTKEGASYVCKTVSPSHYEVKCSESSFNSLVLCFNNMKLIYACSGKHIDLLNENQEIILSSDNIDDLDFNDLNKLEKRLKLLTSMN